MKLGPLTFQWACLACVCRSLQSASRALSSSTALTRVASGKSFLVLNISSFLSDRNHDLAELLVRLQVAVRLDDLLERERPGDDWLEAPVGQPLGDEPLPPLQPRGVGGDFHQAVAADRLALDQDVEQ